jgi:glutathione S-transferase
MAIGNKNDTGRSYRTECTGLALETVKAHEEPADITFFAACFCPFVQRVWIAFELLGVPYKVSAILTPFNINKIDHNLVL